VSHLANESVRTFHLSISAVNISLIAAHVHAGANTTCSIDGFKTSQTGGDIADIVTNYAYKHD